MYRYVTIPQSTIRDFCQPCRARAPCVRFADISPATGGIRPLHKGALDGHHPYTHVLVNDPTTGYGIFIENMLDAAA